MADNNSVNQQKRGFLQAVGRVFNWQKKATAKGAPSAPIPSTDPDGTVSAVPAPTLTGPLNTGPIIDTTATTVPSVPATSNKPPTPGSKLQGRTRYYDTPKPPKTTRQGVQVPSPIEEDMTRVAWYSADWAARQSIYENVDTVLANCKEAEKARERYLDGVFNQGCTYRVAPYKPSPDAPDDKEAIIMAGRANEMWQELERKRSLKHKRELMGARIDYGFAPVELAIDRYGVITELSVLPPFGMEIVLYRGRFLKNQLICYRQHDALVPDQFYGEWPELGIVWVVNQRYSWQPYGVPALLAALGHANGLVRGVNLLPDAREAAQTQVYALLYDAAGNPVPPESIDEFEDTSRAARKERNEELKPTDLMIGNGVRSINALYGDSAFLNDLGDLEMNGAIITATYDADYSALFKPFRTNRSVMEKVEDREFMCWYNGGKTFTEDCDKEEFQQMISAANWGHARSLEAQGVKPEIFINPAKVMLVAEWNARRSPERLVNELDKAIELRKAGHETGKHMISAKRVTLIASRVFEYDPIEEAQWLKEEEEEADAKEQKRIERQAQANKQLPSNQPKQLTTSLPNKEADSSDDTDTEENDEPVN